MICCITSRTHGMYTYAFCTKIASSQVFIIVTRIETALTHSFQYHSDHLQLYLMVLDGGGVLIPARWWIIIYRSIYPGALSIPKLKIWNKNIVISTFNYDSQNLSLILRGPINVAQILNPTYLLLITPANQKSSRMRYYPSNSHIQIDFSIIKLILEWEIINSLACPDV